MAEDAWNSCDPKKVVLAYTPDTRWPNRSEFVSGRAEVQAFLECKWARELDYRLIEEVSAHGRDRIAVRFAYEWHDDSGQWSRSYGNENWECSIEGLMSQRLPASTTSRSPRRSGRFTGREGADLMIILA